MASTPDIESITAIVFADIALIIAAAHVLALIARRLRQPPVMGEIIAGLMLGPSLLGLAPGHLTDTVFPAYARPFLTVLAQLGLALFMFGIGYRLETSHLHGRSLQITSVSLASVALPFGLGVALGYRFYPWYDHGSIRPGGPLGPALFLGAAMSITAFPVLARIVVDRGMQRDRLGAIALACAAIQDVLAWCLLAVVVALVTAGGTRPLAVLAAEAVAFVVVLRYLVRPALTWVLSPDRTWPGQAAAALPILMSGLMLSAWYTSAIGLQAIFGAFAFGATVPRRQLEAVAAYVPERIDQTGTMLLPIFFTVTGLSVDLGGLGTRGLVELLAVVVVACFGKFVGATAPARLAGFDTGESLILGALLNARGLTELVILNVGLGLRVIDQRLFSVMVVMAVVTTLMTGPLLDGLQRRRPVTAPPPESAAARIADASVRQRQ